jgi:hypothetical protein
MNPGQTLTTRIYAQIYTGSIHDGTNIMYECAFVTMFLVLLIILVVHVVIPAYYNYKQTKLQTQSKNTRKIQELFELGHLHFQKIFNKQDLLIRTKNSKINDKKISLNSHRGPSHTSKRWLKRMSIIFLCLIPIGTITAFAIE